MKYIAIAFLLLLNISYASGLPEENEVNQPRVMSEYRPQIPGHDLLIYTTRIQRIDNINSLFVTIVWDYSLEHSSLALVRTWMNMGDMTVGFDAQATAVTWAEEHYTTLPERRAIELGIMINQTTTRQTDEMTVLSAQMEQLRASFVETSSSSRSKSE